MLKYLFLAASFMVVNPFLGCRKRSFNTASQIKESDNARQKGNRCMAGQEYSFILEPLTGDTSFVQSKLFLSNSGKKVTPTKPTSTSNIELHLCLNEDDFSIVSILDLGFFQKDTNGKISYNNKWVVKNLDKAIFNDYKDFELLAISDYEGMDGFPIIRLKGVTSGPIPFVSAGIPVVDNFEPLTLANKYANQNVFVGSFKMDSMALNGKCKVYEEYTKQKFTVGTATFALETCTNSNSISDSMDFRVVSAIITDNNPELKGKNINITLDEEGTAKVFKTSASHHGVGAWGFIANLPEVSYIVSDGTWGDSVSPTLENMPFEEIYYPYDFSCFTGEAFYRIKYGNNEWSKVQRAGFKALEESSVMRNASGEGLINKDTEIKIRPHLHDNGKDAYISEFEEIKIGCKIPANTKIKYKDSCKSLGDPANYMLFLEEPLQQCPQLGTSIVVKSSDFNGAVDIPNK